MLDSAGLLGVLDHRVGEGPFLVSAACPKPLGVSSPLTSQMLPPAPVRTHPGDVPVA